MQLVEVLSAGLHTLPGCADVLDVDHPDHLDWRKVKLFIDRIEGRWLHFTVEPKALGREAEEIIHSNTFRQCLENLAATLFRQMHEDASLNFSQMRVTSFVLEDGHRCVSLHGDAKTQKKIIGYSQHDLLRLAGHWSQICAAKARQRAAGAK